MAHIRPCRVSAAQREEVSGRRPRPCALPNGGAQLRRRPTGARQAQLHSLLTLHTQPGTRLRSYHFQTAKTKRRFLLLNIHASAIAMISCALPALCRHPCAARSPNRMATDATSDAARLAAPEPCRASMRAAEMACAELTKRRR